MENIFPIQVLTSFFVGGFVIAMQSLIAERVSRSAAGLIMATPTTYAIALFFIGWTSSPQAVAEAFIGMPPALGASYFFAVVYAYTSMKLPLRMVPNSIVSMLVSLLFWFTLAISFVLYSDKTIIQSLLGYIIIISLAHYFMYIRPAHQTKAVEMHFTGRQIFYRSVFAGSMVALIVVLSKMLGPVWGGVCSIFPAATLATILMVHREHGAKMLFHVFRTSALGSPSFLIYGIMAAVTFPMFGFVWGTVLSYLPTITYLVVMQKSLQMFEQKGV